MLTLARKGTRATPQPPNLKRFKSSSTAHIKAKVHDHRQRSPLRRLERANHNHQLQHQNQFQHQHQDQHRYQEEKENGVEQREQREQQQQQQQQQQQEEENVEQVQTSSDEHEERQGSNPPEIEQPRWDSCNHRHHEEMFEQASSSASSDDDDGDGYRYSLMVDDCDLLPDREDSRCSLTSPNFSEQTERPYSETNILSPSQQNIAHCVAGTRGSATDVFVSDALQAFAKLDFPIAPPKLRQRPDENGCVLFRTWAVKYECHYMDDGCIQPATIFATGMLSHVLSFS